MREADIDALIDGLRIALHNLNANSAALPTASEDMTAISRAIEGLSRLRPITEKSGN